MKKYPIRTTPGRLLPATTQKSNPLASRDVRPLLLTNAKKRRGCFGEQKVGADGYATVELQQTVEENEATDVVGHEWSNDRLVPHTQGYHG